MTLFEKSQERHWIACSGRLGFAGNRCSPRDRMVRGRRATADARRPSAAHGQRVLYV